MLSRMVPLKSVVSCSTMPICLRREFELDVAQVVAIDGDAALAWGRRSAAQVDDGALARAGGAEQGDPLAGLGFEGDILQDRLRRRRNSGRSHSRT